MNLENIIICLEQKIIFIKNIVNFSKQLEVKSQQEDIDFEDVLTKRLQSMERIDKCDFLINRYLSESEDADDVVTIRGIISGNITATEPRFNTVLEHAKEYREMLQRARTIDNNAISIVKERHCELKGIINEKYPIRTKMFSK